MELADTITGYLFCVFSAPQQKTSSPPTEPVYLRRRAEARFLEELFGHLYESDRIGITTSDDEVVSPNALPAVEAAIRSAIAQVEGQPETWPVLLGHRFEPFQQELGEPIFEPASRQVLLEFLHAVLAQVELAKQRGHYLHWGGGE